MEFRDHILASPPSEFGIDSHLGPAGVWGCLMEMGAENGSATLVALVDGTASIYFSGGGGLIGGGYHEHIANAAKAFVEQSSRHIDSMTKTSEFPPPLPDRVRFYVLTKSGVLTYEDDWDALSKGKHELHSLFRAGHEIITPLRMIDEGTEH